MCIMKKNYNKYFEKADKEAVTHLPDADYFLSASKT